VVNTNNPISINNPIAIKQTALAELSEHIAPGEYLLWGEIKCKCGAAYKLYRGVIFNFPNEDKKYAADVEEYLAIEDREVKPHRTIYDLHFLDRIVEIPE
jgi:hypothetical protein